VMSQKVQAAVALPPMAVAVITANAPTLYPWLVKLMSGPYQLVAGLVIAGGMTWANLHSMAVEAGWKPKTPAPRPAGETAYTDIERARAAAPTMPELRPAEKATEEVLRPGSPDPAPGTQLEAPVLPSGMFEE
jgi:hypothetical protein